MAATATQRTVEAVWRIESARLIAGLARIVRDIGLAEELAADALVAALGGLKGPIMKRTQGKANPVLIDQLLRKFLA